jgi:hypothetical protein
MMGPLLSRSLPSIVRHLEHGSQPAHYVVGNMPSILEASTAEPAWSARAQIALLRASAARRIASTERGGAEPQFCVRFGSDCRVHDGA